MRICEGAIRLHDVRHVKTFKTTDGQSYEAWYYGRTKVTKKDLVIKVSIRRDTESIEVFAAGDDPGDTTGLLAEIGRNLAKQFEEFGRVQPVFNIHIKDSAIQRSNLLSFCEIYGTCGGGEVLGISEKLGRLRRPFPGTVLDFGNFHFHEVSPSFSSLFRQSLFTTLPSFALHAG